MNATLLAKANIKSWARQHGVRPDLSEVPALASLIESIPAVPPAGVDFFSDRLHLLRIGSHAHRRLSSLGFPDGSRFGYRPYCTVKGVSAPAQIQEFFHQPHPGWLVLQIVVIATPTKRAEIEGEITRYLRTGNSD